MISASQLLYLNFLTTLTFFYLVPFGIAYLSFCWTFFFYLVPSGLLISPSTGLFSFTWSLRYCLSLLLLDFFFYLVPSGLLISPSVGLFLLLGPFGDYLSILLFEYFIQKRCKSTTFFSYTQNKPAELSHFLRISSR